MKPLELTARLRNNCLKQRRLALGLSAPQFAAKVGIHYRTYNHLEGLKLSPLASENSRRHWTSRWKPVALKLAAFHGCSPEELWPHIILAVKDPTIIKHLTEDEACVLAGFAASTQLPRSPEELLLEEESRSAVVAGLLGLPERERRALELRFGLKDGTPRDLTEIGEACGGVCRERARQIIDDGLRHLRGSPSLQEITDP